MISSLRFEGVDLDVLARVLYDPSNPGVVVLPKVMGEEFRARLVRECDLRKKDTIRPFNAFNHQDPDYEGGVRRIELGLTLANLEARMDAKRPSYPVTFELVDAFQQRFYDPFSKIAAFTGNKRVNSARINRYEVGSGGLSAHLDGLIYWNLVSVFVVEGDADFGVVKDEENEIHHVDPGSLILMRAPRDQTERSLRPMHYVDNVREYRTTICLREKV